MCAYVFKFQEQLKWEALIPPVADTWAQSGWSHNKDLPICAYNIYYVKLKVLASPSVASLQFLHVQNRPSVYSERLSSNRRSQRATHESHQIGNFLARHHPPR